MHFIQSLRHGSYQMDLTQPQDGFWISAVLLRSLLFALHKGAHQHKAAEQGQRTKDYIDFS